MIEGNAVLNNFVCRRVRRYNDAGVVIKERGGPISQMSITSDVGANVISLDQVLNRRGFERGSHIYTGDAVTRNDVPGSGDCSADGVHRGAKDHAHAIEPVGHGSSPVYIGADKVALYKISRRECVPNQDSLKRIAGKKIARRTRGPSDSAIWHIYSHAVSVSQRFRAGDICADKVALHQRPRGRPVHDIHTKNVSRNEIACSRGCAADRIVRRAGRTSGAHSRSISNLLSAGHVGANEITLYQIILGGLRIERRKKHAISNARNEIARGAGSAADPVVSSIIADSVAPGVCLAYRSREISANEVSLQCILAGIEDGNCAVVVAIDHQTSHHTSS